MSLMLFATPNKDGGSACWDYFSGDGDDNPEEYSALAGADDIEAAWGILWYLGCRAHNRVETPIARTDGSDEVLLLIKNKDWKKHADFRSAWAGIISTPKEKLLAEARLHADRDTIERVRERWIGNDIAGRLCELIYLENAGHAAFDDLTGALDDEPSDAIVQSIITGQVAHLLD